MNQFWKQLIESLTVGILLPGMIFSGSDATGQIPPEAAQVQEVWIPVEKEDGRIVAMELEEYIGRVVLGEMPASFDEEALKAQAVAARTYTLLCVESSNKHHGAVCTDHRCCQTYLDPEDYPGSEENVDKVFAAAHATAGQVLTYNGNLICATYFSSSGGSTEDAQEVWGHAYPYLVAVDSPENSPYDGKTVTFSAEAFQNKLGRTLAGTPKSWFGLTTYTVGGGVDSIWIAGQKYSGVKLRSLLGLRSTVFTVSVAGGEITFQTSGYGHRVGLSQYGADAMAVAGSSYDEILAHYYQGTTLEQYTAQ